ncbi:Acyl carrier protein [Kordia antarctica]|uniref:Acyl carrier protein n=1 Tax=Kordia antarctica TaxID=1218801 RepID=A0A7L4ZIB7_9FLAO|nr:acyl carrier protein [Kordia antarctica]QHI35946.1 Acyl carrier protein [Kordia antarctica]
MESTIKQEVIQTLTNTTKNDRINMNNKLKEDLGLDSIRTISVITKLTKKLDVNILDLSDQDLVNLNTVADLIRLFESISNKKI